MSIINIINNYQHQLEACGLTAEVRFFDSPKIRATLYYAHLALSANLSEEEAHDILQCACIIGMTPVHLRAVVTQKLHILYGESVCVWGPDSSRKSSTYTA